MYQDYPNLAESCLAAAQVVLENLHQHARAESESSRTGAFLRIYRPGAMIISALLLTFVFQVGAAVLSLAMIKPIAFLTPSSAAASDKEKQDEPSSETPEAPPSLPLLETLTAPGRLWRLLILSSAYYFLLFALVFLIDSAMGFRQTSPRVITYVLATAGLAPLHMLWTHTIIANHFTEILTFLLYQRPNYLKRSYTSLFLPSIIYAGAQALILLAPITLGQNLPTLHWDWPSTSRVVAVSGIAVGLTACVLLPATIALTRIEAALLPPGQRTILPFERVTILPDHGTNQPSSSWTKLVVPFMCAIRSVDDEVIWRVFKLYATWIAALLMVSNVPHHWDKSV